MKDHQERIDVLVQQHHILDEAIQSGYRNYMDDQSLEQMKKRKLKIKEEIDYHKKALD